MHVSSRVSLTTFPSARTCSTRRVPSTTRHGSIHSRASMAVSFQINHSTNHFPALSRLFSHQSGNYVRLLWQRVSVFALSGAPDRSTDDSRELDLGCMCNCTCSIVFSAQPDYSVDAISFLYGFLPVFVCMLCGCSSRVVI